MTDLIQNEITDAGLRDWIRPAFSTTTENDIIVASILMMGSMQKYFDFRCRLTCGFPSVTLFGEKSDYEIILERLDRLNIYGDEPTQFANLLRPVLRHFVESFVDPSATNVIQFWQKALTVDNNLSGVTVYSGWITAFCFWNEDGVCLYNDESFINAGDSYRNLHLEGTRYHNIRDDDVPPAWVSVPVIIDDNGETVESRMVAGLVGLNCSTSGLELENGNLGIDSVQPQAGWWIYQTKDVDESTSLDELESDSDYSN